MFITTATRIMKMGFVSFWRNSFLSITTTAIVTLTLLVISSVVILSFLGNIAINSIQDKIDVSVYFKHSTTDQEVLAIKEKLLTLAEVKSVDFVSREEALNRFKAEHQNDALILGSLTGSANPLPASLEIKAKNPGQYEAITQILKDPFYDSLIAQDGVNYYQNKAKIDRLANATGFIRKVGLGMSLGFILMALLVVFNSIRVTIYTRREEIEIMKLVGASSWYIRWPFVLEGALYGVFATVICLAVVLPLVYFFSPQVMKYLGGEGANMISALKGSLIILVIFQFLTGIVIGVGSSLLAIRRHLKI